MPKHVGQIESFVISTRITGSICKSLKEYLATGAHVSVSDYLRDLIRRDLEAKGYKLHIPQEKQGVDILDKKVGEVNGI